MARNPDFVKEILKTFRSTLSAEKTAKILNLDPELVLYWLRREKVDVSSQKVSTIGPEHNSLGAQVAFLRLNSGIETPGDLARMAGMSTHKIGQIERGERDVPFSELVRLARALGVKMSQIVERIV